MSQASALSHAVYVRLGTNALVNTKPHEGAVLSIYLTLRLLLRAANLYLIVLLITTGNGLSFTVIQENKNTIYALARR